jgi:hypothetical protein
MGKDTHMPTNITSPVSLAGAWELVSGSYVGDDQKVIDYTAEGVKSLKVLTENKFSFVSTVGGAFYAAGAGDYTAQAGVYVEIPLLASQTEMVGQRYEFQFTVEGDTWTNSRWKDGLRMEHEVWRRAA